MTIRQIPFLTSSLLMTLVGLYFLVPDQAMLYFSAGNIAHGEAWRIITGHFMHSDPDHLVWNCLGLMVLGTLIEQRSRTLLCMALATGIASVSLLLMTPLAQLEFYCGLSGVLNALLVVAIWLEWQATRSWLAIVVACGSITKVVVEVILGTSLFTHIDWPPFAWSHAAGLAGGLLLIVGVFGSWLPWPYGMVSGASIDKPVDVNEYST
jgi:rhomboid family GlyGly-CTERM serine protease